MAEPKGMIALTGARIITMKGEQVIENGESLTDGKHIKAVGSAGDVSIPKGAQVIDVTGKTIMPGIVDAHAHGSQASDEIIPEQNSEKLSRFIVGCNHDSRSIKRYHGNFCSQRNAKSGNKKSWPRIFSTGTILYGANMPGYTSHIDSFQRMKNFI